jgi:hypothetical protein
MFKSWVARFRDGDFWVCFTLAFAGLTVVAVAEVFWHWYISDASRPLASAMVQYYTHVYPNKGRQSDTPDFFLPTMLIALWLVAVGRGACSILWSTAISLLTSAVLFGLLWVYAALLPSVPAYASPQSPEKPAIIFPLIVPGTAGLVLRYLSYLTPIAILQAIVYWQRRARARTTQDIR